MQQCLLNIAMPYTIELRPDQEISQNLSEAVKNEGNNNPDGFLRDFYSCLLDDSVANVSWKRPVQSDRRFG
jgi:hypothetical protein